MNKIASFAAGFIGGLLICYVGYGLTSNQSVGGGYSQNDLGNALTVSTSSVTTRVKIASAYSGRQYVVVQNGAVASYLSFDPASTTNAIYLAANASYTINNDNRYLGNIYASSTGAASIIIVTSN
jgi:hypothetical protein